jgi:glycosyltransferase involved in cell wall biosynthesis
MRILFVTNFYDVRGSGGEEQSCQQVVEGLKARRHTTLVLTSMHGSGNQPVHADGVSRSLYLEMDLRPWRNSLEFFISRKSREAHNLRHLRQVLAQFSPDIIFIWGMWNLPKSIPALAEAVCPGRVIYRFATYWPLLPSQHEEYWRTPGRTWFSRWPKRLLGTIALFVLARERQQFNLAFENAICVSAATRAKLVEGGLPLSGARVVHTGINVERYLERSKPSVRPESVKLKLLYAGRLTPEKGIHTALEALAKVCRDQGRSDVTLSVAGSGSADYEKELRRLVTQAGLTEYVSFMGWLPPDELQQVMPEFDGLLVPSLWPEPFSRVVLEGMLSGLVVLAARTGGTPEVIADGENGLLFEPGDAQELSLRIARLAQDQAYRRRLALAGRNTILTRYTQGRMLDEIEGYLEEVVGVRTGQAGQPQC